MRQYLLITLALFLTSFSSIAQEKGIYLGVQINKGFTEDPNYSYMPGYMSYKGHSEYGVTGLVMIRKFVGITTGILFNKYKFDIHYQDRSLGTQRLNYLRVPLGARFVFSKKEQSRVKIDFYTGLSFYVLLNGSYSGGGIGPYGTTYADNSTQDFRSVSIGGYTGMGMNIRIGKPCNLLLGFQVADDFGNQSKSGKIQLYEMKTDLIAITLNLGFQVNLFPFKHDITKS